MIKHTNCNVIHACMLSKHITQHSADTCIHDCIHKLYTHAYITVNIRTETWREYGIGPAPYRRRDSSLMRRTFSIGGHIETAITYMYHQGLRFVGPSGKAICQAGERPSFHAPYNKDAVSELLHVRAPHQGKMDARQPEINKAICMTSGHSEGG